MSFMHIIAFNMVCTKDSKIDYGFIETLLFAIN